MPRIKDITGYKFGNLTVVKQSGSAKGRGAMWECVCQCGTNVVVCGCDLRSGHTKSCGCYNKERSKKANTTHGLSSSRLYKIWCNMKNRCADKNNPQFDDYGGRGIDVCYEWDNDFQSFYEWAMKNGYRDNLTVDRIDNDKGYFPENCRWATRKEQNNNSRKNKYLEYDGKKLTVAQWAERIGMEAKTLEMRLLRKWSIEKALTQPIKGKRLENVR